MRYRSELLKLLIKGLIIVTIGFSLFCAGRIFKHFPKLEQPGTHTKDTQPRGNSWGGVKL